MVILFYNEKKKFVSFLWHIFVIILVFSPYGIEECKSTKYLSRFTIDQRVGIQQCHVGQILTVYFFSDSVYFRIQPDYKHI